MPIMPHELTARELLESCAAGLFAAMAVLGTGRIFLRSYVSGPVERAVVSYGIGLAALQPAAVALMLIGCFSARGAAAMLLPGFFVTLRALARVKFPARFPTVFDGFLLGLSLCLILGDLLVSLTPTLNYDALTAQAYLPDLWVVSRRLVPTPWGFATHNMQGAHILLAMPRAFGPIEGSRFFHGLSAAVGLAGVFALGKIYGGERAGLIALLLAETMFTTVLLFHNLQLDFFVATMMTAFFLVLLRILRGENHWRKACIILGGAAGMKYPALSWLPLAAAAIVWRRGWRLGANFGGFSLLAALFFMSPWLVRNGLYKGNPFFPFFSNGPDFWQATAWPPTTAADFLVAGHNLLGIGLTPYVIGLLFAAVVPGLFVAFKNLPPAEKTLGVLSLVGLGLWAIFSRAPWQLTRFYLSGFWLICVVAACGLSLRRWSTALGICVIVVNGLTAWVQITRLTGSLPVALGMASRTSQILAFDPGLPVRQASRDSAVFSLGVYAYGLGPRAVAPSSHDGAFAAPYFVGAVDAGEIARRLRTAGFTHLLVDYGQLHSLQTEGFPFLATDAFAQAIGTWPVVIRTIVPGSTSGTMRGAALFEIPGETFPASFPRKEE